MKNYRLKPEAVQYFKSKLATVISPLDNWEVYGVDIIALEEVEDIYMTYGHKTSDISTSLCGWDEKGSRFHFTIFFPSVKIAEHDKFSKGKIVRELMEKIQNKINDHFKDYVNEPDW